MKRQLLFVHGGGEGAYEEDRKMAASLREALGGGYGVHCPKMPDEDSPPYPAWRDRIAGELAEFDGQVILVGHSLGASILLKFISEERTTTPLAGVYLVAAPYWGVEDWEVDEYVLREDFASKLPEGLPMFFSITAAMTSGYRSSTSRSTRKRFRKQESASSRDAGISSTTICRR
jgi:uncharacterized protein